VVDERTSDTLHVSFACLVTTRRFFREFSAFERFQVGKTYGTDALASTGIYIARHNNMFGVWKAFYIYQRIHVNYECKDMECCLVAFTISP
jgi:hypothetical protein